MQSVSGDPYQPHSVLLLHAGVYCQPYLWEIVSFNGDPCSCIKSTRGDPATSSPGSVPRGVRLIARRNVQSGGGSEILVIGVKVKNNKKNKTKKQQQKTTHDKTNWLGPIACGRDRPSSDHTRTYLALCQTSTSRFSGDHELMFLFIAMWGGCSIFKTRSGTEIRTQYLPGHWPMT